MYPPLEDGERYKADTSPCDRSTRGGLPRFEEEEVPLSKVKIWDHYDHRHRRIAR